MKLGLQLGYWQAQPPTNHAELVAAAEESGFDSIFTAEAWGSDAFTPLAWWGRETSRVRLGTSIVQMSAAARRRRSPCTRSPSTTCRTGGWSSAWASAVRRSSRAGTASRSASRWPGPARSSTSSARCWPVRAPVTNDGPHYPLPFTRRGLGGSRQAAQADHPPLARGHPDLARCRGSQNVAQTAEIADGWIPIFYTPKSAGMYGPWLDEGFARPGARRTRDDFEIAATCHVQIVADAEEKQRVIDGDEADRRALHGRHGRQGARTSTTRSSTGWATRRPPARCRSST